MGSMGVGGQNFKKASGIATMELFCFLSYIVKIIIMVTLSAPIKEFMGKSAYI